jgi:hypothetical protein
MAKFFEIKIDINGEIKFSEPPKMKTIRETLIALFGTSLRYELSYQNLESRWINLDNSQNFMIKQAIAENKNFRIALKLYGKPEYLFDIKDLPLDSDRKNIATPDNFVISNNHIFLEDFIEKLKSEVPGEGISELINKSYFSKLQRLSRKEPFHLERAAERQKLRKSRAPLIVEDRNEEETPCCFGMWKK